MSQEPLQTKLEKDGGAEKMPCLETLDKQLMEGYVLYPLGQARFWCAQEGCLPLQGPGGERLLVFSRPPKVETLAKGRKFFGEDVGLRLGSEEAIMNLLFTEGLPQFPNPLAPNDQGPDLDIRSEAKEQEAVDQPIRALLLWGIGLGLSDIHLIPEGDRCRVRGRKDGYLKEGFEIPQGTYEALLNKLKLLAQMDLSEKRLPQEGHIRLLGDQGPGDLRISTLATRRGEHLVLRLLPSWQGGNLGDLGFLPELADQVQSLARRRQGLLLMTGPTNSGKTTTAYTLLQDLRAHGLAIYSVEDPVEITMEGVNQIQVNRKNKLDFGRALRGILRQDPDIIFIGEIRDEETAQIALRAALTGHLVIASLHVSWAHLAVDRLRDLGASHHLLASSLLAVVNQRLLVRTCTQCLGQEGGCPACGFQGALGRIGLQEVWAVGPEDRQMIQEGTNGPAIRAKAKRQGFVSLWEDGKRKEKLGWLKLDHPLNAWFAEEAGYGDL